MKQQKATHVWKDTCCTPPKGIVGVAKHKYKHRYTQCSRHGDPQERSNIDFIKPSTDFVERKCLDFFDYIKHKRRNAIRVFLLRGMLHPTVVAPPTLNTCTVALQPVSLYQYDFRTQVCTTYWGRCTSTIGCMDIGHCSL